MFAIVDLETTGLNPHDDRIIEIAIILYDGKNVTETFTTLINPEQNLYPFVSRLTGLYNVDLNTAPRFYNIARKIVQLTQKRILVAHNVRFDYAFLRREFLRLGYHFHRRQLCTERLSREKFKELSSYKLGNLCRNFAIPLPRAHRALDDAKATLKLFQKLQISKAQTVEPVNWHSAQKETILPPDLRREQISALPEKTGVYFFYDSAGKLIYIGKSTNIRKRVMGHFSSDMQSQRLHNFKNQIHQIEYEITGSELVALLLESDLIKKKQPKYNRDQKHTRYRYGIFSRKGDNGYFYIYWQILNKAQDKPLNSHPLLAFSNKKELSVFLDKLITRFKLCQKLCGVHKTKGPCFHYHIKLCNGACIGEESPKTYNQRVERALGQFYYDFPNFFIISEGRTNRERSVIVIENGSYRGFGFVNSRNVRQDRFSYLRKCIQNRLDNQDVRRIITRYLQTHQNLTVWEYHGANSKK